MREIIFVAMMSLAVLTLVASAAFMIAYHDFRSCHCTHGHDDYIPPMEV